MKRWIVRLGVICLVLGVMFALAGSALAVTYSVKSITDNSYNDRDPQINDSGQIVWMGYGGTDTEIFLYSNGVTTMLTDNNFFDYSPKINTSGQVAWYGYTYDGIDSEIFLYSNGVTTRLTDNSYNDWNLQINDSGQIVWNGFDGTDNEIFLYSNGVTTKLTDDGYQDWNPQINESGQVVWRGFDGTDDEIYLYSNGVTTKLTGDGYYDCCPQINNSGQVAWIGSDDTDPEIFLYSNGVTTKITDNGYQDWNPQINANGQVVWSGLDGIDWEIYLATPLVPDINVESAIHLGEVAVGSSTTSTVTVNNVGDAPLTFSAEVSGVGLSIIGVTSGTVAPGSSSTITLGCSPTAPGDIQGSLMITSDDPDEGTISIPIDGVAVRTELPPSEQITELLKFYDTSISIGSLYGIGSGNSALNKQKTLRNMIKTTGDYIIKGDYATAIEQLQSILNHCNGIKQGAEFVDGSARPELADRVQKLINALQDL